MILVYMIDHKDNLPTPQASSNSFNSKLSEAVLDKNENAASSWAGVLICKINLAE